jgi:hypothetical protein
MAGGRHGRLVVGVFAVFAVFAAAVVAVVTAVDGLVTGAGTATVAVFAVFAVAVAASLAYRTERGGAARKMGGRPGHGVPTRGGDGRGRDRGAGVVCLAVRVVARLMPPAAGRRWKAEVASFLAECDLGRQRAAAWSWVRGAPWLIVVMWAQAPARRARGAGDRRAAGQLPGERR